MRTNKTRHQTAQPDNKPPFQDRPVQPRANQGRSSPPFTRAELAEWVRKAKDLPDVRWDKVQALREAIKSQEFDVDERLAGLQDKLPKELVEYFRSLGL